MRYSILIGAVIVAVVAYTIYWFVLASQTEDAITAWADRASARGHDVEIADLSMSGYPFRLIARIGRISGNIPTPLRPVHWDSHDLSVVSEPWSRERIQLVFNGDQIVDVPVDSGTARYRVTADDARAAIVRPRGPVADFNLAMENAAVIAAATEARLTAAAIDVHFRRTPETAANGGETPAQDGPDTDADTDDPALPVTARLALGVRDMTLPAGGGGLLGREIAAIEADAVLHGMLAAFTPAALEDWAGAGGTLDVTALALSWGPFRLEAAGTLTLDPDNKPLGAFQARVKGLPEFIDALKAEGRLEAEYAELAQTALKAMEDPDNNGWIRVPFTLQNGRLYMGPIPILALPAIGGK